MTTRADRDAGRFPLVCGCTVWVSGDQIHSQMCAAHLPLVSLIAEWIASLLEVGE